jgi:hypothetical protein
MDYRVMIVSDRALPSGVKRVMVEKRDRAPVLIIAESAADNWRFLQKWEHLYDGGDHDGYYLRAV